jgi:predicted Ser/Thr protein kinase
MRPLGAADPTMIASYRLLGILGGGGMGRVYLGQSPTGRRVAIKVLRPGLADDPQFRQRFAREVAAVRLVNPLFTAAVVDADPDAETPWLASVYIDGPSLEQHVEAHGPLASGAVLTLAAGLAEALASIHRVGLVHRDLKPSNVLLDDAGPHIIDFGIAVISEDPRITTSLVVGTPSYMAPERIHSSEIGPAGDIFSLGATLVYAASGKNLVHDGNMYSQIVQITMGHFDLSKVPAELRPLVVRCTSHQTNDRPTADELARILVAAGVDGPGPGWYRSSRPAPAVPALAPPPARALSRRAVLALGGVVGLAAAAGGALAVSGLLAKRPGGRDETLTATTAVSPTETQPTPGMALWQARLGPRPIVPTLVDSAEVPFLANRDGLIITRTATEVYAEDTNGKRHWTRGLSTDLLDVQAWGTAVLVADPARLWLLDAADGTDRFVRQLAEQETKASHDDNPDGYPVAVRRMLVGADRAFISLGTALVCLDRFGATLWRTPRPPAVDGNRPPAGSPRTANGMWLVTYDATDTGVSIGLYDAATGAAQWVRQYTDPTLMPATSGTGTTAMGGSLPVAPGGGGPGSGGPGGAGPGGGGPDGGSPSPQASWVRSQAYLSRTHIACRAGRHVQVVRVSDGSLAWQFTSPTPIADIVLFGDALLVCADKVTAHALTTGKQLWQLPLRGAQVAVAGDTRSAIIVADQVICAIDGTGNPRWQSPTPDSIATAIPTTLAISDGTAFVTYEPRQGRPGDQPMPDPDATSEVSVVAYALDG